MSGARQAKRREEKSKITPTVKDVKDLGEGFVKAAIVMYSKVDEEKRNRIAVALDEVKKVMDEVPPGILVLSIVNHVHDEVIHHAQMIAQATTVIRKDTVTAEAPAEGGAASEESK